MNNYFSKDDDKLKWTEGSPKELLKTVVCSITSRHNISYDGTEGDYIIMDAPDWVIVIPEKDDKFRLIAAGNPVGGTYNLGRLKSCVRFCVVLTKGKMKPRTNEIREVVFELVDERNALERVLLHFAHFEKEAEKTGENKYLVTLRYDHDDETEILIRILSFGPMIKVLSPNSFVKQIKERLLKQKSCEF